MSKGEKENVTSVRIVNWEKFNPRKDVKNPSWFRLDHGLFENPDFYDFNHAEICAFIYILSMASKKNSDTILVNYAHISRIGRLHRDDFDSALRKLEAIQVVHAHVTHTSRTRHGYERYERTRRDERDNASAREF